MRLRDLFGERRLGGFDVSEPVFELQETPFEQMVTCDTYYDTEHQGRRGTYD
jgi:hypothetical protein